MILASTDKNKKALENYTEVWDEIKEQIELITGHKAIKYGKDFMNIRFESNDDLPLGKILNMPVCVIIVRAILEENSKYYPQVLFHKCFYEYEENTNPPVVQSLKYSVKRIHFCSNKSHYYKFSSCVKCQLQCEKSFIFFYDKILLLINPPIM